MSNIDLSGYNDVASRMREFFDKYPDGRLTEYAPWRVEVIGEKAFVVYQAAAYRTADDPKPGVGTAWEPFPGKTQFTRDSELQNAETSAWGRAILAVGAADTKRGIASQEEVRNRQESWEQAAKPPTPEEARNNWLANARASADGANAEQKAHILVRAQQAAEHGVITAADLGDLTRELRAEQGDAK